MLLMGFSAPYTGISLRSLPPHACFARNLIAIVFPRQEKRSLIPPRGPSIRPGIEPKAANSGI